MKQGDNAYIKNTDQSVEIDSSPFEFEGKQCCFIKIYAGPGERISNTLTWPVDNLETAKENKVLSNS